MSGNLSSQSPSCIQLKGVRVHNLKEIDLEIPLNQMTVLSGVSGSGKTSLASETLFAESQRRFTETTSPRVRQILGGEAKPDADSLGQIPPAVILRENSHSGSDHSTLASFSGVAEYLATLYARLGNIICPDCQLEVIPRNAESIAREIQSWPSGLRFQICFISGDLETETGFDRFVELDEDSPLGAGRLVILDRLKTGQAAGERLIESLEQAYSFSEGSIIVLSEPFLQSSTPQLISISDREWQWFQYSDSLVCSGCQREFITPHPQLFNANSSLGACPKCAGKGSLFQFELSKMIPDDTLSLLEGAVPLANQTRYQTLHAELIASATALNLPVDEPVLTWSAEERNRYWLGMPASGLKGLLQLLEEKFLESSRQPAISFRQRWMLESPCPDCQGDKLRLEARAVQIESKTFLDSHNQVPEQIESFLLRLQEQMPEKEKSDSRTIIQEISERISRLSELGLGHLSLDRVWNSLSAGERKLVQLAGVISSGLVNTLIILDEPARSLHPLDQQRVLKALQAMKEQGNTILIVENSELFLGQADYQVVLGPGAGAEGGEVIFAGEVPVEIHQEYQITTNQAPSQNIFPESFIELENVRTQNLNGFDVRFPLHRLSVVCGVAGSGKNSLVYRTLYPALVKQLGESIDSSLTPLYDSISLPEEVAQVVWMESFTKSASSRSVLATFLKIFPVIREEFAGTALARSRNLQTTDFSFNTSEGGRCAVCSGRGKLEIEMNFLENLQIRCSTCQGKRYRPDILEVRFRGLAIDEVLNLSAKEAFDFFRKIPAIQKKLQVLIELGLGYLELGRPLTTLSHGERQRLRLAEFLSQPARGQTVYLLDEPSAGLHASELVRLRNCFQRLLEIGHTLIVIDHHPQIIREADYLIELGPEAGELGGKLLAQGETREVLADPHSQIGKLLGTQKMV